MSELKVRWKKILKPDSLPIINWIDLGNGTMFRITAFINSNTVRYPRNGFMVGIERVGCFYFDINKYYLSYISEKLYLPEADAGCIADWMNEQVGNNMTQQGKYNKNYILNTDDTYKYGMEKESSIIKPIIIDDIHNEK